MDDYYDWEPETLNKAAVLKLVERHREEYETLTRASDRQTIEDLQGQVRRGRQELAKLKEKMKEQEARWKLRATKAGLVRPTGEELAVGGHEKFETPVRKVK